MEIIGQQLLEEISCLQEINTLDNNLERLLILRKRLNYKQYEMARLLGISYSYYGQVESGKFPLTDLMITRINDFLIKEKKKNGENIFSQYK